MLLQGNSVFMPGETIPDRFLVQLDSQGAVVAPAPMAL